ncbi:MAG: hypothetical protein WDW36_000603 [Sanguina aurantia]
MPHSIYARQTEIGREVAAVQEGLLRLASNTAKLAQLLASLGTALKQVGDFENYLQVVECQLEGVAQGVAGLLAERKAVAPADGSLSHSAAASVDRSVQHCCVTALGRQVRPPNMSSAGVAASLLAIIQSHTHHIRGLSRCQARFGYDVLALMGGLRPAVLIDYTSLPTQQLRELLGELGRAAGVQCCILTLGGCHMLVHTRALARHLSSAVAHGSRAVRFITFETGSRAAPTPASADATCGSGSGGGSSGGGSGGGGGGRKGKKQQHLSRDLEEQQVHLRVMGADEAAAVTSRLASLLSALQALSPPPTHTHTHTHTAHHGSTAPATTSDTPGLAQPSAGSPSTARHTAHLSAPAGEDGDTFPDAQPRPRHSDCGTLGSEDLPHAAHPHPHHPAVQPKLRAHRHGHNADPAATPPTPPGTAQAAPHPFLPPPSTAAHNPLTQPLVTPPSAAAAAAAPTSLPPPTAPAPSTDTPLRPRPDTPPRAPLSPSHQPPPLQARLQGLPPPGVPGLDARSQLSGTGDNAPASPPITAAAPGIPLQRLPHPPNLSPQPDPATAPTSAQAHPQTPAAAAITVETTHHPEADAGAAAVTPGQQQQQQPHARAAVAKDSHAHHRGPPPAAFTKPRVLDLENASKFPGLPLLPTLNGILLGYPIVYVVTSAREAQRAAACLSSDDLTLFRAVARLGCGVSSSSSSHPPTADGAAASVARPGGLQSGGGSGSGAQVVPAEDVSTLCSFSAPDSALNAASGDLLAVVGEWHGSLQRRAAACGDVWGPEGVELRVEARGLTAVAL